MLALIILMTIIHVPETQYKIIMVGDLCAAQSIITKIMH